MKQIERKSSLQTEGKEAKVDWTPPRCQCRTSGKATGSKPNVGIPEGTPDSPSSNPSWGLDS